MRARVFRCILSVTISLVPGILVLGEPGVSAAPILGAAGGVALAVGFGARSLVKDYITGFFLLLEIQMRQGDVVEAGGKAGVVREITRRYLRIRDYSGNVHFVPNGSITTVTNMTRGFAPAVVDAGIAYRENAGAALDVMREVGVQMRQNEVFGPRFPTVWRSPGSRNGRIFRHAALPLQGHADPARECASRVSAAPQNRRF